MAPFKVRIKKLNDKAVVPFKSYSNDFCYDVVATSCEEIAPNVYKYGTGLSFEIMRDCDGMASVPSDVVLSIDFRPRSSVWKTGMSLANCTGTVDEPYRGEVCVIFYHVLPNMPKYEVGDKIGQIKLGITYNIEFEVVDELSETERGSGGFGSTGK